MKIRLHALHILLILIFYNPFTIAATSPKDFIFDFGGVLVLTDTLASFKQIGMINVAACSFRLKISPFRVDQHIKKVLFEVLTTIGKAHNLNTTDTYHRAYDEKGNELPFLMCAWLQGFLSSSEIKTLVEREINLHPEWFSCRTEQRIIQNTVRLIFTPQLFTDSRKISSTGLAFIKRCKREGHKVYGLSNWDTESFVLLKKKFPQLFDLFDGIIISGQVHANKPHQAIYQTLLERYQLQAENCWFIDDQEENVAAAQKLGINAVLHTASFQNLIQNIRFAYSKSVIRRENFKNNGNNDSTIKNNNNAMIDGENISLTDSTKYNCLPANA
jgi:methionine salvage enolase-phosphatase E1